MLGVPRSWVYARSRQCLIPTVELGRYRRFREDAIARGWSRSSSAEPRQPAAEAAAVADGALTWAGAVMAAARS